ncbi:MAG: ATP-dependent sacrificial sulfur transferase LarE [Methanolinea sp.]|nr:ATP-dependent sacrificial sulfur transferase LarE [Methanolinea sp.]
MDAGEGAGTGSGVKGEGAGLPRGLRRKYRALCEKIRERGAMLVSYSGGVDSAFLAAVATEVLGKNARCVFIESPLVPRHAGETALRLARELSLSLEVVTKSGIPPAIASNPPDRCYLCRREDARILLDRARELGIPTVADGVTVSDLSARRPGIRAADEAGIVHPLAEAGLAKEDVRALARERGYSFWDMPSDSCLATRIPYGEEITEERLRTIEAAEEILRGEGFSPVRVRLHGPLARIEVGEGEIPRLAARAGEVAARLRDLGIPYVTLDLAGFRSGSMDEVLGGEGERKAGRQKRARRGT